jgi:hypothetical protein
VVPSLPLEVALHDPLLTGAVVAGPEQRQVHVAGVGPLQAAPRVHVLDGLVHLVVRPGLVAAHPVAPHQLYGTVLVAGVQTVVVGHDLLALGVGEDLVAAQVMTISHAQVLPGLATHRVQTVLGLDVANISEIIIFQRHLRFGIHVLQVPPEALAFQSFSEFSPRGNVSDRHAPRPCAQHTTTNQLALESCASGVL